MRDRALRERPMSVERKAIVLHNRGVVQMQMGATTAARESFERSVKLAREVGMANVALAQLAHREGDFEAAVVLYDEVLTSGMSHPTLAAKEALIAKNRDRAENGQRAQQIALTR
ncbi:MAG: hypothetical protein AAGH19_02710 [Pseudomonadota bacterium]